MEELWMGGRGVDEWKRCGWVEEVWMGGRKVWMGGREVWMGGREVWKERKKCETSKETTL